MLVTELDAGPRLDPFQEKLLEQVGFRPHPEQVAILACDKRSILVAGGGQAGKSVVISDKFFLEWQKDTVRHEGEMLRYWLVAEDYARTRAEFDYISVGFLKLFGEGNVNFSKRVDPGEITVTDGAGNLITRVDTKSAKDPKTLAMHSPHGILICEASQVPYEVYERCWNERLAPNRGWLLQSGTFETSFGHYANLFTAWEMGTESAQSFSLPTWSNLTKFPGGRKDPEILRMEREASDDYFMERIAGRPVPPRGLVFPEVSVDMHVKRGMTFDNTLPVYIWEDPGYGSESAHALYAAQVKEGQVQVMDEIYWQGRITEDIILEAQHRPWWKIPDKVGVSDPYYKDAHHSMTSVAEIWLEKAGLHMGGQKSRINARIERIKSLLKVDPVIKQPRLVFAPHLKGVLSEAGIMPNPFDGQLHPYKWKISPEGIQQGQSPEDKFNHGWDAIGNGLIDLYGYTSGMMKRVAKQKRHI